MDKLKTWLQSLKKGFSKKEGSTYFLIFFTSLFCIDQIIKYIFLNQKIHTNSFLGFSLESFLNYQWAFGSSFGLTPLLSVILFSGLFCTLIYLLILFIYRLPSSKTLIYSILILFTGILSNLLDRLQRGYVLDFISFKIQSHSIYFNTSDILQTIGWIFLVYFTFLYRKKIWVSREQRKSLIVLKKNQMEMIFYLVSVGMIVSLFFLILNYQFINHLKTLSSEEIQLLSGQHFVIHSLIVLSFIFAPTIILAIYFSNKIYGPLYAFNKYTNELIDGKTDRELKLRKNDHLKNEIETLAQKIKNHLKK